MQSSDKVVVVGASAGGLEALVQIVAGLPVEFAAPLLVGLHVPAKHTSYLPSILSRAGVLSASHAVDREPLRAGHIYIAPPGHDLMMVGYCTAVQPSAAQARFRPSLDALFQSAAHHHGPRSIGVILSGALNDGTVGLRSIASAGGTTIVQSDAAFGSMPENALAATKVDHVVPSSEVSPLLERLTDRKRVSAAIEPGQHLGQVMREIETAMRASSRFCGASGESQNSEVDLAELPRETALLRAEERIACLQRVAGRADAHASDRAGALQYLRALESCSERLRRLISKQRVWS